MDTQMELDGLFQSTFSPAIHKKGRGFYILSDSDWKHIQTTSGPFWVWEEEDTKICLSFLLPIEFMEGT